jgi:hypothetical protein
MTKSKSTVTRIALVPDIFHLSKKMIIGCMHCAIRIPNRKITTSDEATLTPAMMITRLAAVKTNLRNEAFCIAENFVPALKVQRRNYKRMDLMICRFNIFLCKSIVAISSVRNGKQGKQTMSCLRLLVSDMNQEVCFLITAAVALSCSYAPHPKLIIALMQAIMAGVLAACTHQYGRRVWAFWDAYLLSIEISHTEDFAVGSHRCASFFSYPRCSHHRRRNTSD